MEMEVVTAEMEMMVMGVTVIVMMVVMMMAMEANTLRLLSWPPRFFARVN